MINRYYSAWLIGVAALLPATLRQAPPARLLDQVRVLGSGRLLIVFAMTALGYGGTFHFYRGHGGEVMARFGNSYRIAHELIASANQTFLALN